MVVVQAAVVGSLVFAGALVAQGSSRHRVAIVSACWVYLLSGLVLGLGVIDDAYISLRYARNFAQGLGLVFNPGEYVEGYTSFLWVLFLGTVGRVTGSGALPLIAWVTGVSAGVGALWLTYRIGRLLSPGTVAPSTLFLIAANFPLLFWSFSGMETSFYLLLLLAASFFFLLYLRRVEPHRNVTLAALFLGLAMLTRPEAALIYAGHLAVVFVRERRLTSRCALWFMLPPALLVVPHFFWRLLYYGSPLPNTYYAKMGAPFSHVLYGAVYLVWGAIPELILLCLIVVRLVRQRLRVTQDEKYLLGVVTLMIMVILITGADHFAEQRYFVYVLPYLYLLAAPEATRLVLPQDAGLGAGLWRRVVSGQGIAALSVLAFLLPFYFDDVGPRSIRFYGVNNAEQWAEVGRWLEDNSNPEDVIASPVVGAIGFYTTRTVVDMLGLTDAVIARAAVPPGGPKDHEGFDTEYVLSRHPAFIYLFSSEQTEEAFLRTPHWIPAIEDLKRYFPHPDYEYELVRGSRSEFAVYRRRPGESSGRDTLRILATTRRLPSESR